MKMVVWALADLVLFWEAAVQLLQAVQMELLLQFSRLTQVLQHLLRESTWEAAANLINDDCLQPHVAVSQQAVAQVVPVEGQSDIRGTAIVPHTTIIWLRRLSHL